MSRWQKGESGNPNGRPRGKETYSTRVRNLLQTRSDEIVNKLLELALSGDHVALKLCMERICPPLKSKDDSIKLNLSLSASLAQQGRELFEAFISGAITSEEANSTLNGLIKFSKLVEFSEMAAKLEEIERKLESFDNNPISKIAEEPEYELADTKS